MIEIIQSTDNPEPHSFRPDWRVCSNRLDMLFCSTRLFKIMKRYSLAITLSIFCTSCGSAPKIKLIDNQMHPDTAIHQIGLWNTRGGAYLEYFGPGSRNSDRVSSYSSYSSKRWIVANWGNPDETFSEKGLFYRVEYESFTASGRWYRAVISRDAAENVTPETAAETIARSEYRIFGGSYFNTPGQIELGPGPVDVDLMRPPVS